VLGDRKSNGRSGGNENDEAALRPAGTRGRRVTWTRRDSSENGAATRKTRATHLVTPSRFRAVVLCRISRRELEGVTSLCRLRRIRPRRRALTSFASFPINSNRRFVTRQLASLSESAPARRFSVSCRQWSATHTFTVFAISLSPSFRGKRCSKDREASRKPPGQRTRCSRVFDNSALVNVSILFPVRKNVQDALESLNEKLI